MNVSIRTEGYLSVLKQAQESPILAEILTDIVGIRVPYATLRRGRIMAVDFGATRPAVSGWIASIQTSAKFAGWSIDACSLLSAVGGVRARCSCWGYETRSASSHISR